MAVKQLFFVYFQLAIFNGLLFSEFSTVSCTSVNDPTSAFDLITNLRPRFKIPRGTVLRYQQPQWEILYFFKHGVFPISPNLSSHFNRTDFLNKMRIMKALWDMDKNSGEEENEESNNINESEVLNEIGSVYKWSSSEKEETGNLANKFRRSKAKGLKIEGNDEFLPVVRKYRGLHPLLSFVSWNPQNEVLSHKVASTSKRGGEPVQLYGPTESYQSNGNKAFGDMAVDRQIRRKFQTQGWK